MEALNQWIERIAYPNNKHIDLNEASLKNDLKDIIRDAVETEREICATIAEEEWAHWATHTLAAIDHFRHIAAVIRGEAPGRNDLGEKAE